MTKLQFISQLLEAINLLLEADVNGCTTHQARICLNAIFDQFEELEGTTPNDKDTSGDLEHYHYLLDSIKDKGVELYHEEQGQDCAATLLKEVLNHIAIKEQNIPKELKQYFHIIHNVYNLHEEEYLAFLDESEGGLISDGSEPNPLDHLFPSINDDINDLTISLQVRV